MGYRVAQVSALSQNENLKQWLGSRTSSLGPARFNNDWPWSPRTNNV